MSRPAFVIDIGSVWLIMKHVTFGTQFCVKTFCCSGSRTVGTVQSNFHTVQRIRNGTFNMLNIKVYRILFTSNAAYSAACGTIIRIDMVQHNCFNLFLQCIWQFKAVPAENFNAIKLAWILRCRNHNARIRF